jgi:hypothetical protein
VHANLLVVLFACHGVLLATVDKQDTSEQGSHTKQDTKSKSSLSTT